MGEFDSLCPSSGRLANVYVILIGVIPSTIALALFFLLFIVVCSNRRQKKNTRRRINFQPPNQATSPRRGFPSESAPTNSQNAGAQLLHQLSPSQAAACASSTSGEALLPNPPSPHFEERTAPSRGSVFATPSFLDSSFSYSGSYSEPTASNVFSEGLPVAGLTSINEEREEEGAGQVGVANIIAKLERGKGKRRTIKEKTTTES